MFEILLDLIKRLLDVSDFVLYRGDLVKVGG